MCFRDRVAGSSVLSPAISQNGGSYPEKAVEERENLAKYCLVILCIFPLTYSSWLPTTHVSRDIGIVNCSSQASSASKYFVYVYFNLNLVLYRKIHLSMFELCAKLLLK